MNHPKYSCNWLYLGTRHANINLHSCINSESNRLLQEYIELNWARCTCTSFPWMYNTFCLLSLFGMFSFKASKDSDNNHNENLKLFSGIIQEAKLKVCIL